MTTDDGRRGAVTGALVTGGASGLGLSTVRRLVDRGLHVTVVDLNEVAGAALQDEFGDAVSFVAADVADEAGVSAAVETATRHGELRVLVNCAGRGGTIRVVDREGEPGSLELYADLVRTNLIGTFNVLRLAAAQMARNEVVDGDRGVCILTASVAAYEGQIGQVAYASAKAGIVGMTIVAARDLSSRAIRVCTIAPGSFDTPILSRHPQKVRDALAASTPHPRRLGQPDEFAMLAMQIVENRMLNGETIRLDGAIRMAPR